MDYILTKATFKNTWVCFDYSDEYPYFVSSHFKNQNENQNPVLL